MAQEQKFCKTCRKTRNLSYFYKSNNLIEYPDGHLDECKDCLTIQVDNWNPETFTKILEKCDVPYIPSEWQKLLKTYGQDPSKVSGTTIIGRYLSKMKIKQFKDWRWKDSSYLQELEDHKITEAMKRQGYEAIEIAEAVAAQKELPQAPFIPGETPEQQSSYQFIPEEQDNDYDLTDEDKTYLRLKWGKTYRPDEWVALEDLYKQMEDSYDIQGAGQEDTLKMICKTSLKSNQLLDIGDVDGAQKMVKMYDMLMKSAGLTAYQNKKKEEDGTNSYSEFVLLCETDGFIPRFYIEKPNDRVDETIKDLQYYTRTLVTEEANLGNLIENAVKQMVIEENKEEDEDIDEEEFIDDYGETHSLSYEDYQELNDQIDQEKEEDEELIENLMKGLKF